MIIYIWKVIAQEKDSIERREHLVGFVGAENSTVENAIENSSKHFESKFENRPFQVVGAEFIGIVSMVRG